MRDQTSPPGDSFRERWPADASEAEYRAGPWIPIVLGGLAGLLGVPVVLTALLLASPILSIGILGISLWALTAAVRAAPPGGARQRRAGRAWRVVAWVLLMAGVGLLAAVLDRVLCGTDACLAAERFDGERILATLATFAAVVGGSVGGAVLVDRAGRRLAAGGRAATRP